MNTGSSARWHLAKKVMSITAVITILVLTVYSVAFGGQRRLPVYYVKTDEKKVAISFDAAWGNEYTEGILDILDTYDVKATFFLVNFWAEEFPDDVRKIYERGHDIGNHSATHPDMAGLAEEEIFNELAITADTIEELTGKRPVLFRPPFGSYSDRLIRCAEEENYTVIQWDIDICATAENKI
ncbi:MAG: polysaccharide deacetylase family protein [Firmicutes bacterium]|nr:polysaccharide deacetylase family protein [Bacillota bacterium]